MFIFADTKSLKTVDLLAFAERAIVPSSGWNSLGELNAIDWRATATVGEVRQLGEALVELLARVDDLLPAERERLLAVVDGEQAKRSFPRFLHDNAAAILKVRRREMRRKSAARTIELAAEKGIERVSVFVPVEDAGRLRAIAAEMMAARGKKMPKRTLGRPKKN